MSITKMLMSSVHTLLMEKLTIYSMITTKYSYVTWFTEPLEFITQILYYVHNIYITDHPEQERQTSKHAWAHDVPVINPSFVVTGLGEFMRCVVIVLDRLGKETFCTCGHHLRRRHEVVELHDHHGHVDDAARHQLDRESLVAWFVESGQGCKWGSSTSCTDAHLRTSQTLDTPPCVGTARRSWLAPHQPAWPWRSMPWPNVERRIC
jgi:hypothetical protein